MCRLERVVNNGELINNLLFERSIYNKQFVKKYYPKVDGNLDNFRELLRYSVAPDTSSIVNYVEAREAFIRIMFEHLNDIEEGKFNITFFGDQASEDLVSWVSRICHIINPEDYPLIYNTRNAARLGWSAGFNRVRDWKVSCLLAKDKRPEYFGCSNFYELDSKLSSGLEVDNIQDLYY